MNIGVLAFQGGVIEHINHIKKLGHNPIEVKSPEDLSNIDGIILPGGESTTMGKLLKITGVYDPLKEKILNGLPTWGTCAGMILLAKNIVNDDTTHLGVMDISVKRNAYGTQIDSFSKKAVIDSISKEPIEMVFIRAPYIEEISENVEPLIYVDENLVAAKQENILVTSFHPELTDNTTMLKYFIDTMIINNKNKLCTK